MQNAQPGMILGTLKRLQTVHSADFTWKIPVMVGHNLLSGINRTTVLSFAAFGGVDDTMLEN